MPEMPEVETIRRCLVASVVGLKIESVSVYDERVLKVTPVEAFRAGLVDATIGHVYRRGKYLLLQLFQGLNSAGFLVIHLNMKGSLRRLRSTHDIVKYECVRINLDNGDALVYSDMWTWGDLHLDTSDDYRLVSDVALLGPEPLTDTWNGAVLGVRLSNKRAMIKAVLLDQKVVAGVGNIYADEALFFAGVLPTRAAMSLSEYECEQLSNSVRDVLGNAVRLGGSQGEYVDLDGSPGRYTPVVYGGKGKPCSLCGGLLVKTSVAGRGTTYCLECQT